MACLLSARTSFSPLSLDSSAGEKVYVLHQIIRDDNVSFILTKVTRDWWIYASARTLVGPQRFISGSVVLSPNRRLASSSKQAADSQNFCRLSNTDAPVYVHRRAISPAFRWHSSEREKKLSNRLAVSSFFQNFRPVDFRSSTDLLHYPDRSLIEATGWIARFPRRARFNACKHETHLEKEEVHQPVRLTCGGLAKLLAPKK